MSAPSLMSAAREGQAARADRLFAQHLDGVRRRVDRLFVALMVGQWPFAIVLALVLSPYAWEGRVSAVHVHVQVAVGLGAALSLLPAVLAWLRPGAALTRHVMAVSQLLWSALLIHLTGGRIETHFHAFGSLAFLAFYRDWRVLMTGSAVVVVDHAVRGWLWPESVFGVAVAEGWRVLEHGFWVAFMDGVLVLACRWMLQEMREVAERRAEAELATEREQERARALDAALAELRALQEHQTRMERLAAVGQLAASVGHELRNPLAAVRNAHAWLSKRLARGPDALSDARVPEFLGLMERELDVCARIISDLLDFSRERAPSLQPCPLRPLVDEALAVVPPREGVRVLNAVPEALPVPRLDKELFRQVLVNLVQNAVEAMPPGRGGEVVVRAEGTEAGPLLVRVVDDGPGIAADVLPRIFEPLFTTKERGTGLGLAIVATLVQRQGGTLRVHSEPGRGSEFIIHLPPPAAARVA